MSASSEPSRSGLVERLKGAAKRAAGSMTGNDQLTREGELHEQKADAMQEAEVLDAEAKQQREEAELAARERELAAHEQRLAAENAADARSVRDEEARRAELERVEREHAARETSVEQEARRQRAAVAAEEAGAALARAAATRSADAIADEADQARHTAAVLDQAIETDPE